MLQNKFKLQDLYKELKEEGKDFGGIYTFQKPSLVIKNPELVGEVLTKRFEHFVNRTALVDQR